MRASLLVPTQLPRDWVVVSTVHIILPAGPQRLPEMKVIIRHVLVKARVICDSHQKRYLLSRNAMKAAIMQVPELKPFRAGNQGQFFW